MQVYRRDVAGVVDRDRAADCVGDLQPAVEPRIEQQDALAVGELDGRNLGLARDLGDTAQIGGKFAPSPQMRQRLYLIGRDSPRRELPAAFSAGVAEPWPLRRRIRLRAYPDVVLAGL